jgi:hypothetical protein
MTKKILGLGTTANDHAGDSIRVAGGKINDNFTELYTALGNGTTIGISNVVKSGSYNDLSDKPLIPNSFNIVSVPSTLTSPGSVRDVAIGAVDGINYLYVCIATDQWKIIPLREDPIVTVSVPTHSYGKLGDRKGYIAIDATYIYVCTTSYVNNTTNVWKRIVLDGTPW